MNAHLDYCNYNHGCETPLDDFLSCLFCERI